MKNVSASAAFGPEALESLGPTHLIAIVLGRDPSDPLCLDIAQALPVLPEAPARRLGRLPEGIRILAAWELARRCPWHTQDPGPGVHGPADLVALARSRGPCRDFGAWSFAMDPMLRIRRTYRIECTGNRTAEQVFRRWLGPALTEPSAYLAFAVRVPKGELVPLPGEIRLLRRFARVAAECGISLLDCVRWNDSGFHSCATAGLVPSLRNQKKS